MSKLFAFAALILTLTGCDTLTKKRLTGTYRYANDNSDYHLLNTFELTDGKFITTDFLGETAMDYTVENGSLYVQAPGTQYRFKIVSADTLRNEGSIGMTGTYVRTK